MADLLSATFYILEIQNVFNVKNSILHNEKGVYYNNGKGNGSFF